MSIKHLGTDQKVFVTAQLAEVPAHGDLMAWTVTDNSPSGDAYAKVKKADVDAAETAVPAGVVFASGSYAVGDLVQLQTWGRCATVNVDGATVEGSPLFVSSSAGRCGITSTVAGVAGVGYRVGIALDADTSNVAPVFLTISK